MAEIIDKARDAFLLFNLWDVLDIALISIILYLLFSMLRRYNLLGILKFVLPFLLVMFLCYLFRDKLRLMGAVGTTVFASMAIILVIVFRHEIRRGILKLASYSREAERYSVNKMYTDEELENCVQEMVKAAISLAKNNVGALIVLTHNELSGSILESGTKMDSIISAPLLECIFNTKAPLHDGAVVVSGNKILAAGCFLPLTQNMNVPKELGTRHRAAIGVTENADVLTIICSEETGVISICKKGVLQRYFDAKMLTQALEQFYGLKAVVKTKGRGSRR